MGANAISGVSVTTGTGTTSTGTLELNVYSGGSMVGSFVITASSPATGGMATFATTTSTNDTEMSGFYDATSGEFTFQGTPTGGNPFWQSNIYGFNFSTGVLDLIVPWGTNGLYAWDEHANTDASHTFIYWSSSFGATAGNYNGNSSPFPGGTGYLPLDKWAAVIPRSTDAQGNSHLGRIGNAFQVTAINVVGSPDRAMTCALVGCPGGHLTVFSGGYVAATQSVGTPYSNILTESVKNVSGAESIYSISLLPFTTRLLGAAVLSGNAVLQ